VIEKCPRRSVHCASERFDQLIKCHHFENEPLPRRGEPRDRVEPDRGANNPRSFAETRQSPSLVVSNSADSSRLARARFLRSPTCHVQVDRRSVPLSNPVQGEIRGRAHRVRFSDSGSIQETGSLSTIPIRHGSDPFYPRGYLFVMHRDTVERDALAR